MAIQQDSVAASLAARRVSWGAILAGAVVALTVQVLLGILGIAIGASVINPISEANPVAGVGIGAGIYFLISSLLSLLAGGYVAGALSAIQERRNRTLHGIATWAVVTVLSLALLATGVGRLVGGTMNIVGKGLSGAGNVASAVASPIADEVGQQLQESNLDLGSLRQEARELLRDTGQPGLQPGQVEQTGDALREQAGDTAAQVARNPQQAEQAMEQLFDRMERTAGETMAAADREALVNLLIERTDMSSAQAQQTVGNWERGYAQMAARAGSQMERMKVEAEQKAREMGQQTAEAVATAAWWSFFMLLLTAVAAAIGANLGADRAVLAVSGRTTR